MPPQSGKGKVSFADTTEQAKDSETVAGGTDLRRGHIELNFGLVKLNGVYSLDALELGAEEVTIQQPEADCISARVEARKGNNMESHQVIVVELAATAPGYLAALLHVTVGKQNIKIAVSAKVMGAGKGTPALKDNVRNLGRLETEETDFE